MDDSTIQARGLRLHAARSTMAVKGGDLGLDQRIDQTIQLVLSSRNERTNCNYNALLDYSPPVATTEIAGAWPGHQCRIWSAVSPVEAGDSIKFLPPNKGPLEFSVFTSSVIFPVQIPSKMSVHWYIVGWACGSGGFGRPAHDRSLVHAADRACPGHHRIQGGHLSLDEGFRPVRRPPNSPA